MSSVFSSLAIILPSLNPDEKFEQVLSGLINGGFENIVIVDDGSDADKQHYFTDAEKYSQCTVLHHDINKGKGRALKDAFEFVHDNLHDIVGVITIDGDGQHLFEDIVACGELMLSSINKVVLGCRNFDVDGVPSKSLAGNKTTSFLFRIIAGIKLSDTQTGLRAIPSQYLELFNNIEGERFDYETNMLLEMKRFGIEFIEQPITTVYEDNNKRSHYRPFRDSIRIFRVLIKFVASSFTSLLIDLVLFYIVFHFLSISGSKNIELISTVIARTFSSVFNFAANKNIVFKDNSSYKKTIIRYYSLCIPQMLISAGFVKLLNILASNSYASLATVFKMIVDFVLFLISYKIQRDWVFANNKA